MQWRVKSWDETTKTFATLTEAKTWTKEHLKTWMNQDDTVEFFADDGISMRACVVDCFGDSRDIGVTIYMLFLLMAESTLTK